MYMLSTLAVGAGAGGGGVPKILDCKKVNKKMEPRARAEKTKIKQETIK